jgi:hypothetical protein
MVKGYQPKFRRISEKEAYSSCFHLCSTHTRYSLVLGILTTAHALDVLTDATSSFKRRSVARVACTIVRYPFGIKDVPLTLLGLYLPHSHTLHRGFYIGIYNLNPFISRMKYRIYSTVCQSGGTIVPRQ